MPSSSHSIHNCEVCWENFKLNELIFCSNKSQEKHGFCKDCVCQDIDANGIRIHEECLGIICLSDCKYPILLIDLRKILPENRIKKVQDRLIEERNKLGNIRDNIERCIRCNIAMERPLAYRRTQTIECIKCQAKHCRKCRCIGEVKKPSKDKEKLEREKKASSELNRLLNEAKVRICPKCSLQFLKETGCNRMTCKCSTTMCYICRASPIPYDHFCNCGRDSIKNGRCEKCHKTCQVYQDAEAYDNERLTEIKKTYDKKVESGVIFTDITFLGENKRRKIGMDMNFPTSIFHLVSSLLTYLLHKPDEYMIQEVQIYNDEKHIFERITKALSDIPMYNCLKCQVQVKKSNINTVEQMLREFISSYPEGRPQLAENIFRRCPPAYTESMQNTCRLCKDKIVNAVIFPCFHVVICDECGTDLKNKNSNRCPTCQGKVTDVKKLNFATSCTAKKLLNK